MSGPAESASPLADTSDSPRGRRARAKRQPANEQPPWPAAFAPDTSGRPPQRRQPSSSSFMSQAGTASRSSPRDGTAAQAAAGQRSPRHEPQRHDSTKSSAPSDSSSTAESTAARRAVDKYKRPRPANLAGPSFHPDQRPRLAQTCPDCHTSYRSQSAGDWSDADGGSTALSGDESVDGSVGSRSIASAMAGKKPLWAIGGVFPKKRRQRRSTATSEGPRADRKGSTTRVAQGADANAPGGSSAGRRRPHRQSHQTSRVRQGSTDPTRPVIEPIAGGETPGSQVIESDLETNRSWTAAERSDPFEEVQGVQSRTRPLDVVVSNDSGRSNEFRHETSFSGEHPSSQSHRREDTAELEKIPSHGSSPTVYGDSPSGSGSKDETEQEENAEELEHERDAEDGHEAGNTGQALGGKLDQRADEWEDDTGEDLPIRNRWGTVRYALREPMAEFLGTLVLIVLGVGSTCQTKLSNETMGAYQSENWAWGFGVMSALYVAGGISGGHANPAVTVTLAIFRGFPWKMVPRYIIAQILGAFCGALILYGNYSRAMAVYDPNKLYYAESGSNISATLFVTAPASTIGTPVQGFCQEILASGILSIAVLALGDENNAPPGAGLGAIVLGFVVVAIGMSNGWVSGYAINPARDLGPRLALTCFGYGSVLWTGYWWWWLLGPVAGTLVGSVAGALVYDVLIFTGPGSPVNYSSRELWLASGIPTVHNMVWIALSPNKRRSRHIMNGQHAAEAGLAAQVAMRTDEQRPGRANSQQLNEAALIQRFRKGRRRVIEQEEEDRRRREERERKIRDSLEEQRRASPPSSSQPDLQAHDEETEGSPVEAT